MSRGAIVLAGGLGTRMKSSKHKVLHEVCGKPMILHILDTLETLEFSQIVVVVGQQREAVEAVVGDRAQIAYQPEQLGTGHATKCALPLLQPGLTSTIVLYGDAPLIQAETIQSLMEEREQRNASAVALTALVDNPFGLGRVILQNEMIERVVEEKDATADERAIRLINTGIYAFSTPDLIESVGKLRNDNVQKEYYLTDTLAILRASGKPVYGHQVKDAEETASVNDRVQLADVERIARNRTNRKWMVAGVTMQDPAETYIGPDVTIGRDTVLLPGTMLEGKTTIGEGCTIGPNVRLIDAAVADGAVVESSVVLHSAVGEEAHVGPFAYVRPGTTIGKRVKVGDFVELKNATVGDDSKVSHLAYIGDADIGRDVNVGCGAITVNYDGKRKFRTVIGDRSFVGSNVNLIAPVKVGEGAYLVAGSTITDDVPDDGFAIARARQDTKAAYVKAWKTRRESAETKE